MKCIRGANMLDEFKKLIERVGSKRYVRSINENFEILDWLKLRTSFLPIDAKIPERTWCVLNNIYEHNRVDLCCNGKRKIFNSLLIGYRCYCGVGKNCECRIKDQTDKITKYHKSLSEEEKLKQKEKTIQTNLKKYGAEHPMKSDEFIQEYFEKNIEKFGVKSTLERPDIIKQIEETNLKNLGVKSPLESKQIQNKIKETNMEKYGKDHHMDLARQTFMDHNNGLNPFQIEEIKEKCKLVNIERYGKPYYSQTHEYISKVQATSLDRYNRENYSQIHISKEICDTLHNKKWLEAELKTKSIFQISKELNIDPNYIYCRAIKYKIIKSKKSVYELEIADFLNNLKIEYKRNCQSVLVKKDIVTGKIIKRNEIDFYIPSEKIGIEICGLFYHRDSFVGENYHYNKFKWCEGLGIDLITIFEDEWLNQKSFILNFLITTLNKNNIIDNNDKYVVQDLRYGSGTWLKDFGFKLTNFIPPKKWYFTNQIKRTEIAETEKYNTIHDCGYYVYQR
jgi:hypothetical protein